MATTAPGMAAWLTIPDGCRMTAQLTGDGEVQFILGELQDDITILFERAALRKFIALASDVLAQPVPNGATATIARPTNPAA